MAYEMVMPYHLHMPSYFLETFTEYPKVTSNEHVAVTELFCSLCKQAQSNYSIRPYGEPLDSYFGLLPLSFLIRYLFLKAILSSNSL